jgi:hypothetical protein
MDFGRATRIAASERRRFSASSWHILSLLLLLGYFALLDARRARNPGSAHAHAAAHATILRGYLLAIFYEWRIAAWLWEECCSRAATWAISAAAVGRVDAASP